MIQHVIVKPSNGSLVLKLQMTNSASKMNNFANQFHFKTALYSD